MTEQLSLIDLPDPPRRVTWLVPFLRCWKHYFGPVPFAMGRMARSLAPLRKEFGMETTLEHLDNFCSEKCVSGDPSVVTIEQFARTFKSWRTKLSPITLEGLSQDERELALQNFREEVMLRVRTYLEGYNGE